MTNYPNFDAQRIKHLEMIQSVIARLGSNGFVVKGWAVTIAAALIGLAVNSEDAELALVTLAPTLAFWGLDTYLLRSERLFRTLYEQVRTGSHHVAPFFMNATADAFINLLPPGSGRHVASRWRTAVRPTLWTFYASLSAAAILAAILIYSS
jgi:hypothetical protein